MLDVNKTALQKSVKRGEEITYLTDLVVEDVFNKFVHFVSASPPPGTGGLWHFDYLAPGSSKIITLVVKVPDKQELEFNSGTSISGEVFVWLADEEDRLQNRGAPKRALRQRGSRQYSFCRRDRCPAGLRKHGGGRRRVRGREICAWVAASRLGVRLGL